MGKEEYKAQKKKWNKGRRKASRPFKGLAILCGIVSVVACIAIVAFSLFQDTIAIYMSIDTYAVENEDDSAVYYESDYESNEERVEYENALVEQIEAEGAVLLTNEDDALPISSDSKVSLFSSSSVNLVYGGTGSGAVDTTDAATLKSAFEDAGCEVNETLWEFYETGEGSEYVRGEAGFAEMMTGDYTYEANEVPWDVYTDEVLDSIEEYGDAAIVVFSRVGGEGVDLNVSYDDDDTSGGYLALSDEERDLLAHLTELKAEGTIETIIVLINTSNALQVDFLFDDQYDIDAALWIGGLGDTGANAVADIIVGNVNPSGSLVDTYLIDNLSSPSVVNFGSTEYTNAEEAGLDSYTSNYVIYQEGIYVGYLYYETRYEDYVMGTGNAGDWIYSDDVAFTFGYGLSYTDFEWSDYEVTYDEVADAFVVQVTVTNTGDVAGADVVQIYGQSPYTDYDEETGVEKASAELVGFGRTSELEPGESETLTIEVDRYELASYDSYGYQTYIFEDGTYYLTAATDAHDAVNNILAAKGYTTSSTDGRMDADGDAGLVYEYVQDEFDATTYSVSDATGAEITNQFDDSDLNLSSLTGDQTITYLSRSDWEGTYPTEVVELYATDEMIDELAELRYDSDTYDGEYVDAEMPTLEADNGVKAADLIGVDYDDSLWDDLLDQMSADDMALLLGAAFHFTQPIESIDLPGTRDENGPQGVTVSLFAMTEDEDTAAMAITSTDVLAATFDTDLAYEVGVAIGNDALDAGVDMLYGPGANIHRTAYSGRNFEYYSEDGFLSGQIAAAECSGISSKGIMVALKHFALNDQELDRTGLCVWANEQSIREIYLKAYEYALTDSTIGVMTSYTRWGCVWAGANEGLLTGVMRNEWGNLGFILSDNSNFVCYYMNGVDSVLAGGNIFDAMIRIEYDQLSEFTDDPVVVSAMRDACHVLIYNIVNSAAMNGITSESEIEVSMPTYQVVVWAVFIVALIGFVVCLTINIMRSSRYRRANRKPKKEDFDI